MSIEFNPAMLTLARESRGLTQTEFAKAIRVTQATVSRYESSQIEPTEEGLEKIAIALDYPPEFFSQDEPIYGVGSACDFYHRKRQDLSTKELRVLHARANILRIQVQLILGKFCQQIKFTRPSSGKAITPEETAIRIRENWCIPQGPIESVIGAIEDAGGIVLMWPFGTKKIDAFTQWPLGHPPYFFVNADAPGDRLRWTVSHELGHILMHDAPTEEMERESDRFAAEFLLPAAETRPVMAGTSLDLAIRLKRYWKVSIAAIVRRARDLRCITDWEYRNIYMTLSKLGWRTTEPYPIEIERAGTVKYLMDTMTTGYLHSESSLQKMIHSNQHDFRRYLMPDPGDGSA